jgi:hypothetical protein
LANAKPQASAPSAKQSTSAAVSKPAPQTPSDKIEQELARVEGVLAEVNKLIEDPASALSTVMRKNVEKTELEHYLRGIRFAIGEDQPK